MTELECTTIAQYPDFQSRVRFWMFRKSVDVLTAQSPPAEADRILAQRVLDNLEQIFPWALAVMTNPTIKSGIHTPTMGASITEGDLEYTVNTVWEAFKI